MPRVFSHLRTYYSKPFYYVAYILYGTTDHFKGLFHDNYYICMQQRVLHCIQLQVCDVLYMHVHAWFDTTCVFVTAMCVSHLWCHGNFIPIKVLFWDHFLGRIFHFGTKFSKNSPLLKILVWVRFFIFLSIVLSETFQFDCSYMSL